MKWWDRLLGLDRLTAVLANLEAERAEHRMLLHEILRTSETQAQTNAQMMQTIAQLAETYTIDGPPEGRHIDDAGEIAILEARRERFDS